MLHILPPLSLKVVYFRKNFTIGFREVHTKKTKFNLIKSLFITPKKN